MAILLILILSVILVFYFYLTRNYNYWSNRGIPFVKGIIPGFGNMWPLVSLQMSIFDIIRQICKSYPTSSMIGFYDKTTPALVIREPELVKTVLQTNFASFSDNVWKLNPYLDRFLNMGPFFASGDVWFTSRKHVTSVFSSRRLKILSSCIEQVCKKLDNFMDQRLMRNNGVMECELKSLFYRYTTEMAAYITFNVEGCCFEDKPHPSSFAANFLNKVMLRMSLHDMFSDILNFYFQDLNTIFRIPFISKDIYSFLRQNMKEVISMRQHKDERRHDFIQLMMDLKNTHGLDEDIFTSNFLTFFVNIYDTSCVTISFAGYLIARHPQIQQKLRDEVEIVLEKYNGQLTCEAVKEMTYLDQVINESQRLYPILSIFAKVCTEEFELKGSDGLSCRVHPGTHIIVPVSELHKNPKYWHDPEVFDPDRFAFDRKAEIKKYTFLPFGEGPRACPGKRMAMLMTKACLATIVRKFSLEISPKTKEPIRFTPSKFVTCADGGLWVKFKRL